MPLEGGLVLDVPGVVDLMSRLEHGARVFGHARNAVKRAPTNHLRHQRLGVKAAVLGQSRSNVSLTKREHALPSALLTRCSKASANAGSMPEEQPAIIEIVPVGAIVVTVELRNGRPSR